MPINVTKLGSSHTMYVTVNITRRLRFRMWIALRLMRLSAWVLGCNIEVTESESDAT